MVGGVIENEFDDGSDAAGMGGVEECLKFLQRSVGWIHGSIVGDIVAIIAQRGGVERKKPNGADVELVDNGVFVPEIVPLQRQGSTPLR